MRQTPNSSWKVRPIEKKDNETVAHIIRKIMTDYACVGDGYSINDPEIDDLYTAFDIEGASFWVLENDDKNVIGCGGIAPLKNGDKDTCELQKLYFLKEARGYGYGKYFVKLCLDTAKKLGYKKCYLETVDRMVEANALYQKMGFQALSNNMGDTGHCSCDAFYVKTL